MSVRLALEVQFDWDLNQMTGFMDRLDGKGGVTLSPGEGFSTYIRWRQMEKKSMQRMEVTHSNFDIGPKLHGIMLSSRPFEDAGFECGVQTRPGNTA
jgi:hypothetical protein